MPLGKIIEIDSFLSGTRPSECYNAILENHGRGLFFVIQGQNHETSYSQFDFKGHNATQVLQFHKRKSWERTRFGMFKAI